MADSFGAACDGFDRASLVPWLLPTFRSAQGTRLRFVSRWSRAQRELLDFNQNAGCALFGHNPPQAVRTILKFVEQRRALRLPLAGSSETEALSEALLDAAQAADTHTCVLGMRSGAEAIDAALTIALQAARVSQGERGCTSLTMESSLPFMLVVLHGSFHGNCTRSAFSASAVFRSHSARQVLCEYDVVSLALDASPEEVGTPGISISLSL